MFRQSLSTIAFIALAILVLLAFYPTLSNEFAGWDDTIYVTKNSLIQTLSFKNTKAIFTNFLSGNYHPLTLSVHAIQYRWFGMNPHYYHLFSLLLHLLNTLILFKLFSRLGITLSVAWIASLFFGIHPMKLESVAWISDLKDLLSTFFVLIAFHCYVEHQETGKLKWYGGTLVFFLLSVLSKATALMFPFLLILIDAFKAHEKKTLRLRNKIPFLIISVIVIVTAFEARESYELSLGEQPFSMIQRLMLGGYRLLFYFFVRFFIPILPQGVLLDFDLILNQPWFLLIFSLLFLLLSFIVSVRYFHTYKTMCFGLLFFILSLLPTMYAVNIGHTADRFSYLGSLGLCLMVGSIFSSLSQRWKGIVIGVLILMVGLMIKTNHDRASIWKSGETIWTDAIRVNPKRPVYYFNRGTTQLMIGNFEKAVEDFDRSLTLFPLDADALYNRGIAYLRLGNYQKGLQDFETILTHYPDNLRARKNRKVTLKLISEAGPTDGVADKTMIHVD